MKEMYTQVQIEEEKQKEKRIEDWLDLIEAFICFVLFKNDDPWKMVIFLFVM